MKRLIILLIITGVFAYIPVVQAETNILNSMSLKVTVIQNEIEKEWEYTNPDEFEVEVGDSVTKGAQAEKEVKELFRRLQINEDAKIEDMVKVMHVGYKLAKMDRLDVRWINQEGKLYTWFWEREE